MGKIVKISNLDFSNLEVNSISYTWIDEENNLEDKRMLYYEINRRSNDSIIIKIELPKIGRPGFSNEIVKIISNFINGFKIVILSNGEFAYVSESNNELLPYRYDFACNFNEYGLAMVAKEGVVSWINKNFEILSQQGIFIDEKTFFSSNSGFTDIGKFSNGKIPLAVLNYSSCGDYFGSYIDTNGQIKQFYNVDENGTIDKTQENDSFCHVSEFNQYDYSIVGPFALLSSGLMIDIFVLIEFCKKFGLLNEINNNVEKITREEKEEAGDYLSYYYDKNKHLKKFYSMDGDEIVDSSQEITVFCEGEDFNDEGYTIFSNKVLFSNGIIIHFYDLLNICAKRGLLDKISSNFNELSGNVRLVK